MAPSLAAAALLLLASLCFTTAAPPPILLRAGTLDVGALVEAGRAAR